MSRMRNIVLPTALFLSVMALSACATKPKEVPVAAPAPVEAVAEKPAALVIEAVAAPAPAVITNQSAVVAEPAPKQEVTKTMKKAFKPKKVAKAKGTPPAAVPAKAVTPEPVVAPAPIVKQEAPAALPPEPSPPEVIAPPAPKIAEAGFLEKYWLWLLGIVIAGVAVWWLKLRQGKQQA